MIDLALAVIVIKEILIIKYKVISFYEIRDIMKKKTPNLSHTSYVLRLCYLSNIICRHHYLHA